MCNGVDVEATKEKIERYRRDHQTMIMKNRERQVRSGPASLSLSLFLSHTHTLSLSLSTVRIGVYNRR